MKQEESNKPLVPDSMNNTVSIFRESGSQGKSNIREVKNGLLHSYLASLIVVYMFIDIHSYKHHQYYLHI